MASSVETGHAKNVDNLGDLIAGVTSFGVKYNPSNPPLSVASSLRLVYQGLRPY